MDAFETEFSRARMIALAQMSIIPLLGFVLYSVGAKIAWPLPGVGLMRMGFLFLSVIAFAAIPLVRSMFLARIGTVQEGVTDGNLLYTLTIAQMAVFEVPLLLGFVLSIQTQALSDFVLFLPITLVGWVQVFPRRSQWDEWLGVDEGGGVITQG